MDESAFTALCFTWNTQSVRIAETVGCGTVDSSWIDYSCTRYDPDFIPALIDKLVETKPSVFVCALQEDAKPGSHLISHALPEALKNVGYLLIKRSRWLGVGGTTFQRLCNSGELVQRGLRLAIFANEEWLAQLSTQAKSTLVYETTAWPATNVDNVTHGKGGLAITLYLPGIGRISFLNCHLPFSASTVKQSNEERIGDGLLTQTKALARLIALVEKTHCFDHLIILGDLNFRILNFSHGVDAASVHDALARSTESRMNVYKTRDELRLAIDYGALSARLSEGVDNCGPCHFMPTGKMRWGRLANSTTREAYYFGDDAAQNPSWCDRVLHCDKDSAPHILRCKYYDRFEHGVTMTRSDHSAVLSLLELVGRKEHVEFRLMQNKNDDAQFEIDVYTIDAKQQDQTDSVLLENAK